MRHIIRITQCASFLFPPESFSLGVDFLQKGGLCITISSKDEEGLLHIRELPFLQTTEGKLFFVATIEDIGAISEDGKRRQTIQLKDVAVMSGNLFTESDGLAKITIEKAEAEKPEEKSAEHNPAAGRNQSIT